MMLQSKTLFRTIKPLVSATYGTLQKKVVANPKQWLNIAFVRHSASVAAEPFLNGSSAVYVEEMYNAWLENPKSVHKVWLYFRVCKIFIQFIFSSSIF